VARFARHDGSLRSLGRFMWLFFFSWFFELKSWVLVVPNRYPQKKKEEKSKWLKAF